MVDSDLSFKYDECAESKLFKRQSRLSIRKYVFVNRIIDKCDSLPESCLKCTRRDNIKSRNQRAVTRNQVKKSSNLESECYMALTCPVLSYATCVAGI